MQRSPLIAVCVLALAATFVAGPALAQEFELGEYTPEQRWQRLGGELADLYAVVVALGESQGMTPEEVGAWMGAFYAEKAWLTGMDAPGYAWWFHRLFSGMPGAETEIVGTTPETVTLRFNRPLEARMGAGDQRLGVPAEKIHSMLRATQDALADAVGMGLERQVDEDHDVVTFTSGYGPLTVANNDIRWARNAWLSWLTWLQLMQLQMESGMTGREIGAADAELYAPGWGAQTPWQLFRGMVWNEMSNPDAGCEVLSASAEQVRARCREYYREVVEANEERFGVTPQDVFDAGAAFSEGVAEHLGMRWEQTLEDGWIMITVSRGDDS